MKDVIEAEVISEKRMELITFDEVINHIEETKQGKITFPHLPTLAGQLQAQFKGQGIDPEVIEINDREDLKEAKAHRAFVNKVFNAFEEERKEAQRQDTQKHKDFLEESKDTVAKVCNETSQAIDKKVREFEAQLIKDTRDFAKDMFLRMIEEHPHKDMWEKLGDTDWVLDSVLEVTGNIGINTTNSAVTKMLEERAKEVNRDFDFIQSQESEKRILEQYVNNGYDVLKAVSFVQEEDKRIEALAQERLRALQEAKEAEGNLPTQEERAVPTAPPVSPVGAVKEADPLTHVKIEMKGPKSAINFILKVAQENGVQVVGAEHIQEENTFF